MILIGSSSIVLYKMAAQMPLFYIDDTWVKILALIAQNKAATTKDEKVGMHTTGILACNDERQIQLFISGTQHAGNNLNDLLTLRAPGLPKPLQMNDALSCNGVTEDTIECNCTTHGRRKFVEIEHLFPKDCDFVIKTIQQLYKLDNHCKDNGFSAENRLKYHQECSKPLMDELKSFMQEQLDKHLVEHNSSLGKAYRYWLKRWDKMTRYLTVAGAPLDNNLVEGALKQIILFRKNCLFHKTTASANITNQLASVLATTKLAGANPIDYFTTLLKNKDQVVKEPENWLPWNYDQQMIIQQAA